MTASSSKETIRTVTVREALRHIRKIVCLKEAPPVVYTAARSLSTLAAADIAITDTAAEGPGIFRISAEKHGGEEDAAQPWVFVQLTASGSGMLSASHAHWLYAAAMLVQRDWLHDDVSGFEAGKRLAPSFPWMRNLSDFLVGSLRHERRFDREWFVEQIAAQGFTHITINGLGALRPFESGPPGDVYSWFYDYSPDIDQFVEGPLTKGYYPPDYLAANLRSLRRNAALARAYGLSPGLHINSPRSMPDEFWGRYAFLRGARVDHPRESFRPRYTLALAHPAVQAHYRALLRNIMKEVPELAFIHLWTNDSGAGFEFVTSLYAGRNGGPYLIREWKGDREIAKKAAENVVAYYRLIAEEAKHVNPGFHLVCDLGPFYAEREYIVPELGKGIDAGAFGYFESKEAEQEQVILSRVGAMTHVKMDVCDTNVIGVPYPWLVHERLMSALSHNTRAVLLGATPASLAPYDINNVVVRAVQFQREKPVADIVQAAATAWVGAGHASALIGIWQHCDTAVRSFPPGVPMSTFGFPWFRLWVRPLVPDIDAIPEPARAYYERFLLATFNNPARIDLNNDMMWNFLTVEEAAEKKSVFDQDVLPALAAAVKRCSEQCNASAKGSREHQLFKDLYDRLVVYRCFCTTMRNTVAWIEGVHGFLGAKTQEERETYRDLTRAMAESEIENTRLLLSVWQHGATEVIPVSGTGETLHMYGENFGELLQEKIDLMEQHKNDEPRIDPGFMWRMPSPLSFEPVRH